MCDCIPDDPLTLSEACAKQAKDESYMWYVDYINSLSNMEFINFLERVMKNYRSVIE